MTVNSYFEARNISKPRNQSADKYINWNGMAIMEDPSKAIEV